MSNITFIGWLKAELMRMSAQDTLSIHKLAILAQEDNPRLAEPLLIYAVEIDAEERLLNYIESPERATEYHRVITLCNRRSILRLHKAEIEQLPWSYQKLLKSWRAVEGAKRRVKQSKLLRLERSLELLKANNIPYAQVYHALGLNPGNTNAYFKHKDTSKLSLESATKVMKYLYTLQK